MLQAVGDRAIADGIPVHERTEALALIHDGGRCYGAVVRDLITGELTAYVAKATALATGGAGRLYRVTTNAVICEGIGTRWRWRPGSPRSATWKRCSSIRPASSRPASWSPRAAAATAAC
jgi:succinate dehydrogenase/fumarate reductase flavoprotein subunit